MPYYRTLDDVVETLRSAQSRQRKCVLLIGAGCSVLAGIPTAQGFVDIIKTDYPRCYKRAIAKDYVACMNELTAGERRDLIAPLVVRANINWAHIAIALLLKHKFVDRVLTTNFDNLVLRACALLDVFPAVYDVATSKLFRPRDIHNEAIFYLHGQYTGFILINTADEISKHSEYVHPAIEAAGEERVWIVVGYSGENDPVFNQLISIDRFDNRLYWVGYKDANPANHVRVSLLENNKDAFYIQGYDADMFFVELTKNLGIFPPPFLDKPFTHLLNERNHLSKFPTSSPDHDKSVSGPSWGDDILKSTNGWINEAIGNYEKESQPVQASIADKVSMISEKYSEVIKRYLQEGDNASDELVKLAGWAYMKSGNKYLSQAKQQKGATADKLYELAYSEYLASSNISPTSSTALFNWGTGLLHQARTKQGEESYRLYTQACDKYQAAINIKPDMFGAVFNFAIALSEYATLIGGEEAIKLYEQAIDKYKAALVIKPNAFEALMGWGSILCIQAKKANGEEIDRLFGQAYDKYRTALDIKPDDYFTLVNWGSGLSDQAELKDPLDAEKLYKQALEKYQAAITIKPDGYQAINSMAGTYIMLGALKDNDIAKQLYKSAIDFSMRAEAIEPGKGAYNIACGYARLGDDSSCQEWIEKAIALSTIPSREHLERDPDLESVRNTPWFQAMLSRIK